MRMRNGAGQWRDSYVNGGGGVSTLYSRFGGGQGLAREGREASGRPECCSPSS